MVVTLKLSALAECKTKQSQVLFLFELDFDTADYTCVIDFPGLILDVLGQPIVDL
jgi:UDP-glucose 4-epimerase